MKEGSSLSIDWQEINKNVNNLLLTLKCEAGDLGKPLEQYAGENKILIPAEDKGRINENRFVVSNNGELSFSELYPCLGIILVDQEKKLVLAAHTTLPVFKDDSEKDCKSYLEQFDNICDIDVTRVVLISSQLGRYPYHQIMEDLIKERYKLDNIEHYKELTVNYNVDTDTVSKTKVIY